MSLPVNGREPNKIIVKKINKTTKEEISSTELSKVMCNNKLVWSGIEQVVYGTDNGIFWESNDGYFPQYHKSTLPYEYKDRFAYIRYAKGIWIAPSLFYNTLMYSTDAKTWSLVNGLNARLQMVYFANNMWVGYTGSGLYYSKDGINWFVCNIPTSTISLNGVLGSENGFWIAYGSNMNQVLRSEDGINWYTMNIRDFQNRTMPTDSFFTTGCVDKYGKIHLVGNLSGTVAGNICSIRTEDTSGLLRQVGEADIAPIVKLKYISRTDMFIGVLEDGSLLTSVFLEDEDLTDVSPTLPLHEGEIIFNIYFTPNGDQYLITTKDNNLYQSRIFIADSESLNWEVANSDYLDITYFRYGAYYYFDSNVYSECWHIPCSYQGKASTLIIRKSETGAVFTVNLGWTSHLVDVSEEDIPITAMCVWSNKIDPKEMMNAWS